jgi:hypothetical protein
MYDGCFGVSVPSQLCARYVNLPDIKEFFREWMTSVLGDGGLFLEMMI